jgi:3-oxoacyl-[acyl-carrier protein] reductase
MRRLEGKVALVTGGGRGIGLSLVAQLAAEGARVVVNDLDAEPAEAAARAVVDAGGSAATCVGNVTDTEFPSRFIGAALDRFGDVNILVNNAGYVWNGPLHRIADEQWDAMQEVHLKAPFRMLRELHGFLRRRVAEEAAAGMRVQRKIVNVSSISATGGAAGQANYAAAKAGLIGLTRSLAKEWGPLNVNVNCVAFGLIETRLTQEIKGETAIEIAGKAYRVGFLRENLKDYRRRIPLGRFGTPAEAAGGIMLFCLPESDYVTGQVLEVAGGIMN